MATLLCYACNATSPFPSHLESSENCPQCDSEFVEIKDEPGPPGPTPASRTTPEAPPTSLPPHGSVSIVTIGVNLLEGSDDTMLQSIRDAVALLDGGRFLRQMNMLPAPTGNPRAWTAHSEVFDRFMSRMTAHSEVFDRFMSHMLESHRPPTIATAQSVIDALPRRLISAPAAGTQPDTGPSDSSAGCSNQGDSGAKIAASPCTVHYYHEDCILPWLQGHNTCPICRHEMEQAANETPQPQNEPRPSTRFRTFTHRLPQSQARPSPGALTQAQRTLGIVRSMSQTHRRTLSNGLRTLNQTDLQTPGSDSATPASFLPPGIASLLSGSGFVQIPVPTPGGATSTGNVPGAPPSPLPSSPPPLVPIFLHPVIGAPPLRRSRARSLATSAPPSQHLPAHVCTVPTPPARHPRLHLPAHVCPTAPSPVAQASTSLLHQNSPTLGGLTRLPCTAAAPGPSAESADTSDTSPMTVPALASRSPQENTFTCNKAQRVVLPPKAQRVVLPTKAQRVVPPTSNKASMDQQRGSSNPGGGSSSRPKRRHGREDDAPPSKRGKRGDESGKQ
eukprot:gene16139-22293_t